MIVWHEKVVRVSLEGDEILRVHGERTLGAAKALMNAKLDKMKLSDISIVRNLIDVFPEDLSITTTATTPSEMQELSEQHQGLQDKVLELLRKEKLYVKVPKSDGNEGLGSTYGHLSEIMITLRLQECEIRYHPGKANGVADALSRKAIWSDQRFLLGNPQAANGTKVGCMVRLWRYNEGCVINFGGSYLSSIRCTPFEALYGRKYASWCAMVDISVTRLFVYLKMPIEIGDYKVKRQFLLDELQGRVCKCVVTQIMVFDEFLLDRGMSEVSGVYVCVYVDYVGVGTQSIERDRLIGIGVVLDNSFRSLLSDGEMIIEI
ncbi:hypothetical protein Tco_0763676 [Tanacetum coccineum]